MVTVKHCTVANFLKLTGIQTNSPKLLFFSSILLTLLSYPLRHILTKTPKLQRHPKIETNTRERK